MFVKLRLNQDLFPNRIYGPYDQVFYSEPMEVDLEELKKQAVVHEVLPGKRNLLVQGLRRMTTESGKPTYVREVLVVGDNQADVYILNEQGNTIEVAWRARWAS